MTQRFVVAVMLILAFGVPSTAWPQGVSQGMLVGHVRDGSGGVLPKAAISVSSAQLIGGTRSLVTDADGAFRLPALPAGSYDIEASASGFTAARRTDVTLEPGATVVLDFTLEVAGLQDQVVIEGHAGGVDVKSPAAPFRIDQTLLFNLPTSRDVTRLINLVPGVSADVSFGGSQRSNALSVDGTNVTDPMFQDPQLRVNQNWVEQVHVTGLGASAEFGGSTGVGANSVLRSGGNRTSGSRRSSGPSSPNGWPTTPATWPRSCRPTSPRARSHSWWEANGQVGGAITARPAVVLHGPAGGAARRHAGRVHR